MLSESTTSPNRGKNTGEGGTLLDQVIRNHMGDLDPYAQNAITTMTVRVLQSAINVTNMVTSLVTVGVQEYHNNNTRRQRSGQKPTCFECGAQGHFKKECPRLKNNKGNRGNQAGNDRHHEGADRSFVSTAFSSQIDITPSTLDHYMMLNEAYGDNRVKTSILKVAH
ncbi:putative reverse transcriptase domain-containing protein [Tanacetum coccineum]